MNDPLFMSMREKHNQKESWQSADYTLHIMKFEGLILPLRRTRMDSRFYADFEEMTVANENAMAICAK